MKYIKLNGALLAFCILLPLAHAGELAGSLNWSQRLAMGALVSGVVNKVAVRPGQRVRKGDLLLSLDDRGFRAEVASAKASLKLSEILLEEAVREDERADELYERTILSEHERVLATIALHKAQATEAKAKAAYVQASLSLERSQLRAPFDGVVLSLNAIPGQTIVSNLQSETLLTLADNKKMYFVASASGKTTQEVMQAESIYVEFAGQRVKGADVQIALEPTEGSQAPAFYALQVKFVAPDKMLMRLGENARLTW